MKSLYRRFLDGLRVMKRGLLFLQPSTCFSKNDTRVKKIIDFRIASAIESWIEEKRYLLPQTMQQAADDMGISRDQLSYFFHTYHSTSFLKWRKERRIDEAKALLLSQPDLSLSDLAVSVGINDRSNMRRQFQEVTGMSPSEWVSSVR